MTWYEVTTYEEPTSVGGWEGLQDDDDFAEVWMTNQLWEYGVKGIQAERTASPKAVK